jgi:hypothetical protein
MERSEKMKTYIEEINPKQIQKNPYGYFSIIWENTPADEAELLRKSLIVTNGTVDIYTVDDKEAFTFSYGNCFFEKNEAARRKVSDYYLMISRLYACAVENPLKVIYEQMNWIKRDEADLTILDSDFLADYKAKLVERLLMVVDYDKERIIELKKEIVKTYRKYCFPEITVKNTSLSNDKLREICNDNDLELKETKGEKGNKLYSIVKKSDEKGGKAL